MVRRCPACTRSPGQARSEQLERTAPPQGKAARRRPPLLAFEAEADLQGDLEVRHLAVDHMATRLHHLEPVDMADRAGRGLDRIADGGVGALVRGADDFDELVDAIGHLVLLGGADRRRQAAQSAPGSARGPSPRNLFAASKRRTAAV